MMKTGAKAFALIVDEETGGQAYYTKTEQSATWPGGASGVTIGIGYDCGYVSAAQITADWSDKLPATQVHALGEVAGITGPAAHSHAVELRHVIGVPWAAAIAVFTTRDIPRWERIIDLALANAGDLPPDCYGVLVSLAFNRGGSFHAIGSRYLEMRNIAALMRTKQFNSIPEQIRAMKRLWPDNFAEDRDLRARRDHEAALFESALKNAA
jgi:hypothetical protein